MQKHPDRKVAVVTGANRGIGLEVARQLSAQGLHVVLTARSAAAGKAAVERLGKEGDRPSLESFELDVTRAPDIERLAEHLEKEYGRLDVLVNNAGVLLDEGGSALSVPADVLRKTLETNVYGPYQLMQRLAPLMRRNGYGRIVNVSSGMGQLAEMNSGYPAYRVSKTALNALTRVFSQELSGSGDLKVNSACPGWVKTDMGGAGAELEVSEGADTIVWLATLPAGGPTGGFFRERKRIDW